MKGKHQLNILYSWKHDFEIADDPKGDHVVDQLVVGFRSPKLIGVPVGPRLSLGPKNHKWQIRLKTGIY